MTAAPMLLPKKDKYEQLLAKYDWSSPFPPRGYQFGVGRGAKPFSTSAELSSAIGATTAPFLLSTPETNGLLDALDRLEERRQKRRRDDAKKSHRVAATTHENAKPKTLLSMDDLATVGSGMAGHSLVKRKARTEDMDVIDDHAFADETSVVTAGDLLRSQTFTTNQTLENILGMGSPTEQTTWITHSRAFREMGMTKKAQQTLMEGCRLTGAKGPFIWKERLEYTQDPAAQRQLLEEAVKACSGCEELWLLLLEHEPPHEQLHWLQQAVMMCPSSENLWLRVLQHISAPRDQKKIIRKALEVTPQLPSLWAMLARLESYEAGKAIFNAAAAEHLSLQIIVEASKFEEFHLHAHVKDGNGTQEGGQQGLSNERIQCFVRQAAGRFLVVDEEKSRREWLEAARAAAFERYIVTSAYMYLYFVSDRTAASLSVPATWIEDLMALLPDAWQTHETLCAAWAAMLILHQTCSKASQGDSGVTEKEVEVMTAALHLAPSLAMDAILSALAQHPFLTNAFVVKSGKVEEEQEEELDLPAKTTTSALSPANGATTSATAASHSLPLPLTCVFLPTLLPMPSLATAEVTIRIAKVLYDRRLYEGALHVLQLGILQHPTNTSLFAAAAKTLVALDREAQAVELLLRGTELLAVDSDIVWVKLAVHQRSKGEKILPLLGKALNMFPKSEKLWLMRLEAEGMRIKGLLDDAAMRGVSTSAFITELRQIYMKALGLAHCRFSPAVWCYAAERLESTLLSNASAARALLLEGVVVCGQQEPSRKAEIHATFGLARCHVELMHGGRETALEVVRETLQLLPKKNGCFTVSVGELVSLSIDLEAPAARGRAAAQAVQHWHVRDPLVISSIAKVYHAAGKCDKAFDQALKAVKMSQGRCGDAVALWLKLASLPAYSHVVRLLMGVTDEAELSNTEESAPMSMLLPWLWSQVGADGGDTDPASDAGSREKRTAKINNGPLWLHVAKIRDPSNVTLLGYRDSIESMLQQVMDLIEL
ncbi:hypothetical protein TraAM80_04721 [Trypanosoma rangeli]|uniref:PRP1 splicing factor N-terminal domain-containing protein n=1 Tax=Trypanosoma rangeli TaxID=5698 RepID=A0A3R7KEU6_TRYRA|nr:uncharacterized protein TraAM80_04721 [Trypanosoma rangeli]RNF05075.1 hypothetical protein TraAM80_04721 [Trypanosoma rangeli]|eukprot:RNF05075.1 hypothetical protein TraAM80_04721 [Trypanosoma rangeli]